MENCRRGKRAGNSAGGRRVACNDGVASYVADNETITNSETIAGSEAVTRDDAYPGS